MQKCNRILWITEHDPTPVSDLDKFEEVADVSLSHLINRGVGVQWGMISKSSLVVMSVFESSA